jgi:serine/threonine protein kinase
MDKYRKVKIVGKGSFGYAVLVESKKSKRQYIMKIIDISKMDEKQIEEALNEVQLLKIMRYPYVVTYRESFMEKMYKRPHLGASASLWTTAKVEICSTRSPDRKNWGRCFLNNR